MSGGVPWNLTQVAALPLLPLLLQWRGGREVGRPSFHRLSLLGGGGITPSTHPLRSKAHPPGVPPLDTTSSAVSFSPLEGGLEGVKRMRMSSSPTSSPRAILQEAGFGPVTVEACSKLWEEGGGVGEEEEDIMGEVPVGSSGLPDNSAGPGTKNASAGGPPTLRTRTPVAAHSQAYAYRSIKPIVLFVQRKTIC